MTRWKYKSELVTVGENSQTVRQLTAEERKQFSLTTKRIAAGEMTSADVPQLLVKFGAIDPILSDEDVAAMPPDLLDACVDKITALSGMDRKASDDDEKKETQASAPTT